MSQIEDGGDHITVHLEMCLSEIIRSLLHCDLLMSHLQTLAFWRRNHDNRPTLGWQTCPHARTHPNASLPSILAFHLLLTTPIARSIHLVDTHKPSTKISTEPKPTKQTYLFHYTPCNA